MKRCVIVGGAEIRTYERVRSYFRPDDFFIYCDCGLRHQALRRGFDDFLLVGVSGGRLDHTLVNVYLLVMLREQGKRALLVDDYAEMELIGSEPAEISDKYPFYSLVNITGTARGITETGCKFPLDNGEIRCDYQYGTSNEVLPGQTAVVSVKEGNLLLIRDFPE